MGVQGVGEGWGKQSQSSSLSINHNFLREKWGKSGVCFTSWDPYHYAKPAHWRWQYKTVNVILTVLITRMHAYTSRTLAHVHRNTGQPIMTCFPGQCTGRCKCNVGTCEMFLKVTSLVCELQTTELWFTCLPARFLQITLVMMTLEFNSPPPLSIVSVH